jgi:hypothetical protein
LIAAKRERAVIPPAERLVGLRKPAEDVFESELEERAQRRTLGRRAQNLPFPRCGVVHVAIFRGDVEVANDGEQGMAGELVGQQAAQRGQPLELVAVFVGIDPLAVGHVEIPEA